MAYKTTLDSSVQVSIKLGDIVNKQISTMTVVRKRERSLKEAKFQQTVIDQGLSYDAQLEYRKQQLAEEKKAPGAVDEEYLSTIEGSIKDIRKLIKFQKIRNNYLENYESLKTGKINLAQHLSYLQDQYNAESDETVRTELRDEISKVRIEIGTSEVNTLNNRVLLAQKDGTVNLLNTVINEVVNRKAFADLAGNSEESSAWDVSLAALKKQLNETEVSNSLHDIDFKVSQYGGSSIQKLDMLNNQISTADGNSPITINGTRYNSAKDYWTGTRDAYINGIGATGNFQSFFNDFEKEVQSKIDTVSKVNKFGFVPVSTLEGIQNDYNNLSNRSEFVNVNTKLTASKVLALSYGVEKSANALITSATEALQLKTGQDALKSLQLKFGIDTTGKQFELQGKIISKGSELPAIKNAAEQLKEVGAETPSEELPIGTDPESLFKANNQPTIIPVNNAKQPEATPTPSAPPAETVVVPEFDEYVIKSGDTLSGIAQTKLGDSKRFKELASLNNLADPNKIVAGAKLKIPKK